MDAMDTVAKRPLSSQAWDGDIVPQLVEYIHHSEQVADVRRRLGPTAWNRPVQLDGAGWAKAQSVPGMQAGSGALEGRTPLIFIDIPATGPAETGADTVRAVRPFDKQPEMTGWDDDLGPWVPVIKGDKLWPRRAPTTVTRSSVAGPPSVHCSSRASHARCVVLIEACEESGSYDLPPHVDHLADRIGKPSLVVCLDSGCGNYEQLWCTTVAAVRAGGNFTVKVLEEGVHSGDARASCPRASALRQLLSRLEDGQTAASWSDGLQVEIPADRAQARGRSRTCSATAVFDKFRSCPACPDGRRPPSWCSIAPGARRCRSPASTASRRRLGRQRAAPFTSVNCRCACRPRWTASAAANC